MTGDDGEQLTIFVVRLSEAAAVGIETEHARLEEQAGAEAADAWEDALMGAISTLATYPERCTVASENDLFQCASPGQTLRLFLFQRRRGGPIWRVLFTVHKDEADAPTVRVQRVRHGARAPMTDWDEE